MRMSVLVGCLKTHRCRSVSSLERMRGFCRPYVLLHHTVQCVPLGCLPTRAFVSWLLEVRGWLLFPDSLTLCPQYWFHTRWPYYDIPGFIRHRGLAPGLSSFTRRMIHHRLWWMLWKMDCLLDLGKQKGKYLLLFVLLRVHSHFLLCWKMNLPLGPGYWTHFLPGWWNWRSFGNGAYARHVFT